MAKNSEYVQDAKNTLWRREEQLKRWDISDTNKESDRRNATDSLVRFDEGCVFLAACSSCDTDEVERLLSTGSDINTTNVDGLTALHQACIDNNDKMVKFLVERGADINASDNEGWTALHATASCGSVDIARYLVLKGARLDAVSNDRELPVDLADDKSLKALLTDLMDKQGIDADCARNEELQMMTRDANLWLNNGVYDEKPHPKTGAMALHIAAAKGYVEVIRLLIKAGADVNVRDNDGWTPLHAAAHWGQTEACTILAHNFANMTALTHSGETPLDIADGQLEQLLVELQRKQESLSQLNVIEHVRPSASNTRRSSIIRMSSERKQDVVLKTADDERRQIGVMRASVDEETEEAPLADGEEDEEEESSEQDENEEEEEEESGEEEEITADKKLSDITINDVNVESQHKQNLAVSSTAGVNQDADSETPATGSSSADVNSRLSSSKLSNSSEPPPPPPPLPAAAAAAVQAVDTSIRRTDAKPMDTDVVLREKPAASAEVEKPALESEPVVMRRATAASGSKASAVIASEVVEPADIGRLDSLTRASCRNAVLLDSDISSTAGTAGTTSATGTDGTTANQKFVEPKTPASRTSSAPAAPLTSAFSSAASSVSRIGLLSRNEPLQRRPYTSVFGIDDESKSRGLSPVTRTMSGSGLTSNVPRATSTSLSSVATATTAASSSSTSAMLAQLSYAQPSIELLRRRRQAGETDVAMTTEVPTTAASSTVSSAGSSSGSSGGHLLSQATVAALAALANTPRRSIELPKRDDEKEVERKARAKRARESRRSTQGVTKEDLVRAEESLQAANTTTTDSTTTTATTTTSQTSTVTTTDSVESVNSLTSPASDSTLSTTTTTTTTDSASSLPQSEFVSFRKPRDRNTVATDDMERLVAANVLNVAGQSRPASSITALTSSVTKPLAATTTAPVVVTTAPVTTSTAPVAVTTSSLSSLPSSTYRGMSSYRSKYLQEKEQQQQQQEKTESQVDERNKKSIDTASDAVKQSVAASDAVKQPVADSDAVKQSDDRLSSVKTTKQMSTTDNNDKDAIDSSQKSAAIRARRKRDSRRSTGKISVDDIQGLFDDDESADEDKAADLAESNPPSSLQAVSTTLPSSVSRRSQPNNIVTAPLVHPEPDYKLLYEAERSANERLRKELKQLLQELTQLRAELDTQRTATCTEIRTSTGSIDRRTAFQEKRTLEKKILDLEDQLKAVDTLKNDNQRLKDENGALIRVISKLSK